MNLLVRKNSKIVFLTSYSGLNQISEKGVQRIPGGYLCIKDFQNLGI
jgi:hypothetical protein